MIDLSVMIGAVIAVLLAVVMGKVWPLVKAFLPPAALAVIQWVARAVVDGVESEYAGEDGWRKRERAFARINEALRPMLEYLAAHGYKVDPERIYEAIEAAWRVMNAEQLMTGEKELTQGEELAEDEYEDE